MPMWRAHGAQLRPAELDDVLAAEQDLARGRLDQAVDAADQRRLAGAGRADDRGQAAACDLERDVAQHRLAGAVLLAQIADDQRPLPLAGVGRGGCVAVADTLMGHVLAAIA